MPQHTRKEALARGLKTYASGRPCKRSHPVLRRATTGKCLACEPLDAKIWGDKNAERRRERDKGYRVADPEKFKARDEARSRAKGVGPFKPALSKTDPAAYKQKRACQQRDRRVNNPEKIRKEARNYRDANVDKMNAWVRQDRIDNPEKYAAQEKRRRNTDTNRLRKMVNQTAKALISGQLAHSRFELLGYSPAEYSLHIESTLPAGISREQARSEGYQTDHIVPISFIAKNFPPEKYPNHLGFKIATDLMNLRMIPGIENMKKHASMKTPEQFILFNQLCEKYRVGNE